MTKKGKLLPFVDVPIYNLDLPNFTVLTYLTNLPFFLSTKKAFGGVLFQTCKIINRRGCNREDI